MKELTLTHVHKLSKIKLNQIRDSDSAGIVGSEGNRWKFQRNFLSSHFSFPSLKSRTPIINEITKEFLEKLKT